MSASGGGEDGFDSGWEALAVATIQYPRKFELAAKFMATHPTLQASLSIEDKLMFYGLEQQATVGVCNIPSPHLWNRVERAKWEVWKQLGKTSTIEAMFLYTREIERLYPRWAQVAIESEHANAQRSDPCHYHTNVRKQWRPLAPDIASALGVPLPPHLQSSVPSAPASPAAAPLAPDAGDPTAAVASDPPPSAPTELEEEVAYGTWVGAVTTGPAPAPRYQHSANILGRRMVVFGGYGTCFLSDVHMLDIDSRTWVQPHVSESNGLPEARAGHTGTTVCSKDGADAGRLVIFGGHCTSGSLSDVFFLRWSSLRGLGAGGGGRGRAHGVVGECVVEWERMEEQGSGMGPKARGGHCAVALEAGMGGVGMAGGVVVFGGEDADGGCLDDLWVLDLDECAWRRVGVGGCGPRARLDAGMQRVGERVLLFGGSDGARALDDVWVLRPAEWSWAAVRTGGSISPGPRAGYGSAVFGGKLLVLGGGDGEQGLHGVYALKLEDEGGGGLTGEDGESVHERGQARWDIVRAGYSHSTGGITVAREGSSVVSFEECVVVFGGYNGRYVNDVLVLRLPHDCDWAQGTAATGQGTANELMTACKVIARPMCLCACV